MVQEVPHPFSDLFRYTNSHNTNAFWYRDGQYGHAVVLGDVVVGNGPAPFFISFPAVAGITSSTFPDQKKQHGTSHCGGGRAVHSRSPRLRLPVQLMQNRLQYLFPMNWTGVDRTPH